MWEHGWKTRPLLLQPRASAANKEYGSVFALLWLQHHVDVFKSKTSCSLLQTIPEPNLRQRILGAQRISEEQRILECATNNALFQPSVPISWPYLSFRLRTWINSCSIAIISLLDIRHHQFLDSIKDIIVKYSVRWKIKQNKTWNSVPTFELQHSGLSREQFALIHCLTQRETMRNYQLFTKWVHRLRHSWLKNIATEGSARPLRWRDRRQSKCDDWKFEGSYGDGKSEVLKSKISYFWLTHEQFFPNPLFHAAWDNGNL